MNNVRNLILQYLNGKHINFSVVTPFPETNRPVSIYTEVTYAPYGEAFKGDLWMFRILKYDDP